LQSPHVRYVPLAAFEGYRLPEGEPWSPVASQLLIMQRDKLCIVDASDSTLAPRTLLESQVLDVHWAPDGTAVLCRVRVPTAMRGGSIRLQFVDAAGGPVESRPPRARIAATLWAEDGAVYFWGAKNGARIRMQAPLSWRSRHPVLPESPAAHLLQIPTPRSRRLRVVCFEAGKPAVEKIVEALMAPQASHVTLLDEFPMTASSDSARFLVQLQPPGGSLRTYVVNAGGERLARLGDASGLPSFVGTSVSSDGRYVIGHRAKQGAGTLFSSELWIAAADGTWSAAVEGAGSTAVARLSRHDFLLAQENPDGDAVRLGRLQLITP
jgi:hypothetical protein